MKNRLSILLVLVLFLPIIGISQDEPNKITRKQLNSMLIVHDTISTPILYLNGKVKFNNLYCSIEVKYNDQQFKYTPYIKNEKYRKNSTLKYEYFYDKGLIIKAIEYDSKGNITFQSNYQYDIPEKLTVTLGKKLLISKQSNTYKSFTYNNGVLKLKASFLDKKKHGVWEYYNKRSGVLTKKITWEDGNKISKEKIL